MRRPTGVYVAAALAVWSLAGCQMELVDGGFDLAQGTIELEAPSRSTGPSHQFIPFTPPAPGRTTISISWSPEASRVSFVVSEGACSTSPCPAEIDMGRHTGVETALYPISGSRHLSPRLYTIRIDNPGPGAATASYGIRLIPE
jgi:hypothetical protein